MEPNSVLENTENQSIVEPENHLSKKTGSTLHERIIKSIENCVDSIYITYFNECILICVLLVSSLYARIYFILPWILWKQMLMDTVVFLLLPFLLAVFWKMIGSIGDFLNYENLKLNYDLRTLTKGAELHVWEAPKYFSYVNSTYFRYISPGYDVAEDVTKDVGKQAVEVQEQTESTKVESEC